MAEKKFEETAFSRVIKVCSEISEALEKEEFDALDALFAQRKDLSKLTPVMSQSEIDGVLALDRGIIRGLEIKRALAATGIAEVRRAKTALQSLKTNRSAASMRRRMAVSA